MQYTITPVQMQQYDDQSPAEMAVAIAEGMLARERPGEAVINVATWADGRDIIVQLDTEPRAVEGTITLAVTDDERARLIDTIGSALELLSVRGYDDDRLALLERVWLALEPSDRVQPVHPQADR